MPVVGSAPAVILTPELSEREKRERLEELSEALKGHRKIREKILRVIPLLDEIIQDCVQFQNKCDRNHLLRAIHLSRTFRFPVLFKVIAIARTQLDQIHKASAKAESRTEILEREILDPELPGVYRDPREVRETLRAMSNASKSAANSSKPPAEGQKPK